MYQAAIDFCAEMQARQSPRWLSLLGPSGTGKTFLAKRIHEFVSEQCCYFTVGTGEDRVILTHQHYWCSWIDEISSMKRGDFSTVDNLCEKETKWNGKKGMTLWFAVVDDIGQAEEGRKEYLVDALGRIANSRLEAWTVFTSNRTLEQIGAIDRRISSRMLRGGNQVIENHAVDFNFR